MAIVVYECDTCKRSVDLQQNPRGLDVFGRCIITDECKGKLHQVKVKPDHVVGQVTPDQAGLLNWTPRKLFYEYEQTLSSSLWKITHNLTTNPSVNVYVKTVDGGLEEITPTQIQYVDANTVYVTLDSQYVGIAQCLARSTTVDSVVTAKPVVYDLINVTPIAGSNAYLTIATTDTASTVQFDFTFTNADTAEPLITDTLTFTAPPYGITDAVTPWFGVERVMINGKLYTVRTAPINIAVTVPAVFELATAIQSQSAFVLMASAPYTEYDRVVDRVIDLSDLTSEAATKSTAYFDNKMSISSSLLRTTYPNIQYV